MTPNNRRLISVGAAAGIAGLAMVSLYAVAAGFVERQQGIADLREELEAARLAEQRSRNPTAGRPIASVLEVRRFVSVSAEASLSQIQRVVHDIGGPPMIVESVRSIAPIDGAPFPAVRATIALKSVPSRSVGTIIARLEHANPAILIDLVHITGRSMPPGADPDEPGDGQELVDMAATVRSYHEKGLPAKETISGTDP